LDRDGDSKRAELELDDRASEEFALVCARKVEDWLADPDGVMVATLKH
jgi:hypothetical protein